MEIFITAALTAAACALPGTFLTLKKTAMLSDSVTHSVLLGIVLGYFITHDLSSPLLVLGAALAGVLAVWLTERLQKTRLLSEESSVGLVFPLLFSLAVILITRYSSSVHLDTDSVLLGELTFAPLSRITLFGADLGPKSAWLMGAVLALNAVLTMLFFKELKLSSFDSAQYRILGFSPLIISYALTASVSVTAVAAFESAGSVLVVALMTGPPAIARLFQSRLEGLILLSLVLSVLLSGAGYVVAIILDVSVAGCIACVCGLSFAAGLAFSPGGALTARIKRVRLLSLIRLASQAYACSVSMDKPHQAEITAVSNQGLIELSGNNAVLTCKGKELVLRALAGK